MFMSGTWPSLLIKQISVAEAPDSFHQYHMGPGGGGRFDETLDEKMHDYSFSVIMLFRGCIKTSTESEWSWTNVGKA